VLGVVNTFCRKPDSLLHRNHLRNSNYATNLPRFYSHAAAAVYSVPRTQDGQRGAQATRRLASKMSVGVRVALKESARLLRELVHD